MPAEPRLPFLSEPRRKERGVVISEEYIIPEVDKLKVLQRMYPFSDKPKLDDERYDLNANKRFKLRDFKVIREDGANILVSPFYYKSGSTAMDWIPVHLAEARRKA